MTYMVAFLYPTGDSGWFDYDHFVNVHLPLGIGLTGKHLGLRPERIVVYNPCCDADGSREQAAFAAISSVFFKTEQEARTFCTLFTVEEAASRLSADFANYTAGAPEVLMAEVRELSDMDAMLARFEAL